MPAALGERLALGLETLGLQRDADRERLLLEYVALLRRWNQVYNLTAVNEPEAMVDRHLLDSLAVVPFLQGTRFVDVGSGAGLPGIPLAIWLPQCHFTLLDSGGRKVRFLTQVKIALRLDNVRVVQARVEHWSEDAEFAGVLSRAFASLPDFVRRAGHLAEPRGTLYALKGAWPVPGETNLPEPFEIGACNPLAVPGEAAHRHLIEVRRASA